MPQAIRPVPGVYRCQDAVNHNREFTVVVDETGVGCIFGEFIEEPAPGGGVMFRLEHYQPPVILTFFADGTFVLVKPGPDAAGSYAPI